MANGVEYRNQFFTSAAQSQHRVNVCWGKQLRAYSLRSRLLALAVDDGLVYHTGGGGQHRARAGRGDVFQPRVPPAQNRAFAGAPLLRNAVYFAGVRLEIHVQQRLRHCELPRVDLLHLYEQAPLWFDNPGSSFVLVVLFAIWRYFPYAFISFLAILQTIDKSLYEAAEMDGANAWQRFRIVTLPAIMPVLATVVTLRTIWMFYMFADVYLLTTKVVILGVYLYKTAFAFNDLGKAAAISVVLFIIIFAVILLTRKRVNLNGNK